MQQQKSKVLISIKIISDTICPWCLIGLERMKSAIQQSQDEFEFSYYFTPFLLNKNIPEKGGMHFVDYFKAKGMHGISLDKLKDWHVNLKEIGLSLDNPVAFKTPTDQFRMYNTVNSHRIVAWALQKYGKQIQVQLYDKIMREYFEQRIDISDPQVLKRIVNELKLDSEEAIKILENDSTPTKKEIYELVEDNIAESQAQGVPFFIINNQIAFSGAQDSQTFIKIFQQIKNKPELHISKL